MSVELHQNGRASSIGCLKNWQIKGAARFMQNNCSDKVCVREGGRDHTHTQTHIHTHARTHTHLVLVGCMLSNLENAWRRNGGEKPRNVEALGGFHQCPCVLARKNVV